MRVAKNAAGLLKPAPLAAGDKVAIVSLSSGMLGEPFARHQLELGCARLCEFGLAPVVMPHTLDGLAALDAHPEWRAADLKSAFADPAIRGIICAIGGEDTYRLAPYLLEDSAFGERVREAPKLFTGFSDTTVDHLMLYQLGLQTFYGPNFLNDLAELDTGMLPYSRQTFAHYFERTATTKIESSPVWYEERTDFSADALGRPRVSHPETHGIVVLHGTGQVRGPLLGGCIESLDDLLTERIPDAHAANREYGLFPAPEMWAGKILFLETSEERPTPANYEAMVAHLAETGVFAQVAGMIVGKPQNERYFDDYQAILTGIANEYDLPVLFNLNFGHAYPRTALPYGAEAVLDCDAGTLTIAESLFAAQAD